VGLGEQTIEILLIVAVVLAVVAAGLGVAALLGQRRVQRAYARFSLGRDEDVLELLRRHVDDVDALRGEVAVLTTYTDELRGLLRSSISRVGTVRYDAFEDMGGRLSFSAALMDEHGDGVVITSINGRTETRTYAKPLVGGTSKHNISEEEQSAIDRAAAMAGRSGEPGEGGGRGTGRRRKVSDAS
jgi:hypothetical protein